MRPGPGHGSCRGTKHGGDSPRRCCKVPVLLGPRGGGEGPRGDREPGVHARSPGGHRLRVHRLQEPPLVPPSRPPVLPRFSRQSERGPDGVLPKDVRPVEDGRESKQWHQDLAGAPAQPVPRHPELRDHELPEPPGLAGPSPGPLHCPGSEQAPAPPPPVRDAARSQRQR